MQYWTATVFVAAVFGGFVMLRRQVAGLVCLVVAAVSGGLWLFATLRRRGEGRQRGGGAQAEERRRLAEMMSANFYAMQESRAPMPRARAGWLATGAPESGYSPTRMEFPVGLRLGVRGGEDFALFRCTVVGPDGATYEDTSGDGSFLTELHPRRGHTVRWPDEFPAPDPVPSGVYRAGWHAYVNGRWTFLDGLDFTVTPEGRYRC